MYVDCEAEEVLPSVADPCTYFRTVGRDAKLHARAITDEAAVTNAGQFSDDFKLQKIRHHPRGISRSAILDGFCRRNGLILARKISTQISTLGKLARDFSIKFNMIGVTKSDLKSVGRKAMPVRVRPPAPSAIPCRHKRTASAREAVLSSTNVSAHVSRFREHGMCPYAMHVRSGGASGLKAA